MQKIRVLSYLTMMLILFQSFSAVASSLDFHIVDAKHLQHEHSHEADDKQANTFINNLYSAIDITVNNALDYSTEIPDSQQNHADCHHCGHCSGSHAQWVSQQTTGRIQLGQQSHQFYYLQTMINGPVNPLLRPPKA